MAAQALATHLKLTSNDLAVTRPLADTPVEALLASLRPAKAKGFMLSHESTQPAPYAPESFVVEVFAELDPDTIQKRWQHVNVVLRLSMLTGLQMQLDATLNLLCDMATEIATCEKSLVYFWDEGHEQMELRLVRGIEKNESVLREVSAGNVMNLWVVEYGRPLLISRGQHRQADSLLEMMDAALGPRRFHCSSAIEWLDHFNFSRPTGKAFRRQMRNFCGSCHWLRRTFSPANPPTKASSGSPLLIT